MKRQSHLIAVVSQLKKKKTVSKLAKFARGEDLRTKPSYEGALAANHVDLSLLHYIKSHSTEKPLKCIAR